MVVMYILILFSSFLLNQNVVESQAITNYGSSKFITTKGTRFMKGDRAFYFNGFNSYWLMSMASDPLSKKNVTSAFNISAIHGMTVARTWAFSDGGTTALQSSPGIYNENVFKALDFVISEAGKYGIYLILSLVNSYPDYGGRRQYVEWAKQKGQYLKCEDDFYTNPMAKGFYKNHVKKVIERKNSITGLQYKDDPTIFAWELINEPRCEIDLSGKLVQGWVKEMAAYVKSIDRNHLLEIGLEGFYGESKKQSNPNGYLFGTDFITSNQIPDIDFATIHAYPDQWFSGSNDNTQLKFARRWLHDHIYDSALVIRKPLVYGEFGKSSNVSGFNMKQRDTYYDSVYNDVYACAKDGGPCTGALFWQMLNEGMSNWNDGYQVVLTEHHSTAQLIAQQSSKLAQLNSR